MRIPQNFERDISSYSEWQGGWFLGGSTRSWMLKWKGRGRSSISSRSQHGSWFISCRRSCWPSLSRTTSHGSPTPEASGWGPGTRPGLTSKWSENILSLSYRSLDALFLSLDGYSLVLMLSHWISHHSQAETEGSLHVRCWVLHLLDIRVTLLGDKTVGLWGLDVAPSGDCRSYHVIIYFQVCFLMQKWEFRPTFSSVFWIFSLENE